MGRATTPSLLAAVLVLTSAAGAQSGEWRALQRLPAGTRLKIKLKRGHTFGHCEFLGATEGALTCDYGGRLRYSQMEYSRGNIRAIYRTHDARMIGLGIGAAAGAVMGAATTSGPAAGKGFFAAIDACILGAGGYFFGVIADPFFHGKAVYEAPRSKER